MDIDNHYEMLARLYLRLKGYVASNLIIHSEDHGNNKAEIDIVGIRSPYHSQEYRKVDVEDYLDCSNERIEVLIGDVKNYSSIEEVEFNKGLRRDTQSVIQLVNWIGLYQNVTNEKIAQYESFLNLHRINDWNGFAFFDEDLPIGKFRIKFTFFCPSLPKWNGKGFKYIHGEEMNSFIWECLNEMKRIETCSRRYGFEAWNELKQYVEFFKGKTEKPTLADFESYCADLKKAKKSKS